MTDSFEQAARAERARKQRQRKRGMRAALRIHIAVFLAVQVLLVGIWAMTGAGTPWFVFPLLGWGVGLAAHAAAASDSRWIYGRDDDAEDAR
ncbi:MAG TPA: 2TM domain-containing protein [Acidimicrobiales bacterium]|nr:2TM domain-containing protein [Acidimicrobiales bacterium]